MAFIPLFDRNPRVFLTYPWVTWGLIVACTYIFIQQAGISPERWLASAYGYGIVPALLSGEAVLPPGWTAPTSIVTLITYQFLHGSWMHLFGNMLFLFVFGDNVEDAMGHLKFLAFYLICGIAAALIHVAAFPGSPVPVVGASGAVSGVLGAYLMLHPRAPVLVPIIIFPFFFPAWVLLIFWFAFQLVGASGGEGAEGIAWWAHIGGFLTGVVLIIFFRRRTVPLFGSGQPPKGIRLRDPSQWRRPTAKPRRSGDGSPRNRRRGPWG